MAQDQDRARRKPRCGYCNVLGHIQTNQKACWQNRKLVENDGEAYVHEDLLRTMRGLLLGVPHEVQEVKRMLSNGVRPKTAECIDFILYHQIKANDQMKATLQLVGRVTERMSSGAQVRRPAGSATNG